MTVLYKGQPVEKINNYLVRYGHLLIQVKPEELSDCNDLRCKFCAGEPTVFGIHLLKGYPWSIVRVCKPCLYTWCVRETNEDGEVRNSLQDL